MATEFFLTLSEPRLLFSESLGSVGFVLDFRLALLSDRLEVDTSVRAFDRSEFHADFRSEFRKFRLASGFSKEDRAFDSVGNSDVVREA